MPDPRPQAGDLVHVATVNGWVRQWHGLPEPADLEVHAAADFVAVAAPGVVGFPLSADEALELADALAEAAATARNLERQAQADAPMLAHARRVVEATLGIRWPVA